MVGLARATLMIEAGPQSGTLITARLTVDYNRELFVVPGSIFSDQSQGTHQFLKLGATPVTCPLDITNELGLKPLSHRETPTTPPPRDPVAQVVLDALSEPKDQDELIRALDQPAAHVSALLMRLSLTGYIHEADGLWYRGPGT
jgi:DNA processing protein